MAPPEKPPIAQEKVLLTWSAPVRLFQPRNRQFFSTAIVIFILISVILSIAGEWMLIATVAALIFAYYLWTTVPPENTEHSLTTFGIRTHDQLIRWDTMDRWWIDSQWNRRVLNVDTPLLFPTRLLLILDSAKEKSVTEIMSKYLLMEKPRPTNIDKAGAWLARKFPLEKEN